MDKLNRKNWASGKCFKCSADTNKAVWIGKEKVWFCKFHYQIWVRIEQNVLDLIKKFYD